MSSRINGAQQPSRDLFGGVLQSNTDIFNLDSPKASRFHQLKVDIGDRSSDEISLNSPNRRTPIHKQHNDILDNSNLSLATINQKTNTSNTSNTPLWFNNPKRRTVPSNVIKRSENDHDASSFLIKTKSSNISSSSGFNTVQFGTRRNASELSHVNALSDELPPTRTISDLRKEDNTDSLTNDTLSNTTVNTDQKNLPTSAFSTPSKSNGSVLTFPLNSKQQQQLSLQTSQKEEQEQKHKLSTESAVLVFGYPESIANNVIKYFNKFGTILEDFESTRINPIFNSNKPKKIYPIYTGNGWVKLTYDNKASAVRALEENGSVYFGVIIGCVPYSKDAIERIASISINELQDIGESEFLSNSIENNNSNENSNSNSNDNNSKEDLIKFNPNKKSTRLNLKTDDKIFINSKDLKKTLYSNKILQSSNSNNNNSILNKVNNWLFGWEDL